MAGPSYIAQDSEIVALDRAVPLADNPRHGDVMACARSFARFGQRKPIVLRRLDPAGGLGEIEAGNTSYAAVVMLNDMAASLTKATTATRRKILNGIRSKLGEEATDALHQTVEEHGPDAWSQILVTWIDEELEEGLAFAATDNHTARLGHDDPEALRRLTDRVAAVEAGLLELFTVAPDPLPPPEPDPQPPQDRPARLSGSNGTSGRSRDPMEATALRTMAFTMNLADYAWVQAHVGNLRRDWDLPDDTQVILRLVADRVGARPPGMVHVAADETDEDDL